VLADSAKDVQLERTWIVAPVQEGYPRAHEVTVAHIDEVLKDLRGITAVG